MTIQTSPTLSDDASEPSSINGNQKTTPSLYHIAKIEELETRLNKMAQFVSTLTKKNDEEIGEIWTKINEKGNRGPTTVYSYQSPTIGKLALSLSKAQSKFCLIEATGSTGRSNTHALTLADMFPAVMPVLAEHGLAVTFDLTYNEHEDEILILKLIHESGEWMSTGALLMADKTMPNEPEQQKKRNSATTYLMKNMFRTKLCIGKE